MSTDISSCGKKAQQCQLGLVQESDFAGDLEDSKSPSKRSLLHFQKSHVCANESGVLKTNFSSHSSTEVETNYLDTRFGMDCFPVLTLWVLIIEIFHSTTSKNQQGTRRGRSNRTCITSTVSNHKRRSNDQ